MEQEKSLLTRSVGLQILMLNARAVNDSIFQRALKLVCFVVDLSQHHKA